MLSKIKKNENKKKSYLKQTLGWGKKGYYFRSGNGAEIWPLEAENPLHHQQSCVLEQDTLSSLLSAG